jgi:cytochrome c peroxidase
MQLSRTLVALALFAFSFTPAVAQFLEDPSPPPPSAKELDLPIIIDIVSGLDLVDEASGDGANGFIKDETAAILLGKALFWDMQMGSDEIACATCHYHAGADNRSKNQVSPGLNGGNGVFDVQNGGKIGPNSALLAKDFPFHELVDPADRDSLVLFDTDDVSSSAGMFASDFTDIVEGDAIDDCTPVGNSHPFELSNGLNTRQVEPRNTPTIINAAFNHRNFWDGRANNIFNGVDSFGQRNTNARVLEVQGGSVVPIQVALENSSLASQAMAPVLASFETSCINRIFPKVGKKLLSVQALALQKVHPQDSVLGAYRANPRGLAISYETMIQNAISDRFWDSNKLFDANQNELPGTGVPANTDEYTLMEANFSLIWGLAIQAFERTQISDDAPYDQWAEAPGNEGRSTAEDNGRGILSGQQMRGMELFFTNALNLSGPGPKTGSRANCSTCHQGPMFSTATFPFTIEEESGEFPEQEQLVERMRRGDGVNVLEDLLRFFVSGEGQIGPFYVSGKAGSRELPNIWRATVGGDISLNGVPCTVESFLMNQDRTAPFPEDVLPTREPPESRGEFPAADYSTKDAVFRVTGCGAPFAGPAGLEITINDNGGPGMDTATIKSVIFGGLYAPFPSGDPLRPVYAFTVADNVPVGGDFTLENSTLYDTAFYNIGVRPSAEDPGIAANDPFGNPLSFTQQWINQLLGTPMPDAAAFPQLNFGRVVEPFNWFGDAVFFPGGMAGYGWMTHDYHVNPLYPGAACFDGFGGPPVGPFPDEATCEAADPNYVWIVQAEFNLLPNVGEYFAGLNGGRGDDAVPAYGQFGNFANAQAIATMPTALDGAFKVPHLRNVELTGPFFHNGGAGTLEQVVEFYNRGGDFAIENLGDLAPNIHPLDLDAGQMADIIEFLKAFTDERVRCKQEPFDHPEIILPEGHQTQDDGTGQAKDKTTTINAVGASGLNANKCIGSFL